MTELGIVRGSPDSDCNSNHHGSASYLSNTSSQDVDFIQDNSDYQWFLDYGYRDGSTNHHTSILSLPESYDAGDVIYYDIFSKNMDANLAEADMESFKTEDIHALLTNLPPLCTDHLSQENNRQGECYASMSGSVMEKFDLESSLSAPQSNSSHGGSVNSNSMSICKSELLFSPVREAPVMPQVNFSVDSLDCDLHDMMLTCQANKDNYTIAFEGSMTMYSEDSDYHGTEKSGNSQNTNSTCWSNKDTKEKHTDMTQSDSSSFTTWSKLKKRSSDDHLRRQPSGNNNNSAEGENSLMLNETALKSQSLPNLYKQKLKSASSSSTETTVKRKPVKVFNIQHHLNHSNSASISEMATSVDVSNIESNKQPNFNLVKLFMKQKSMSTEGMSTTMDQLSSSDNCQSVESSAGSKDVKNASENEGSFREHGQITEETEEDMSESVEQLSERASVGSLEKDNGNDGFKNENKRRKQELINRSIQTSSFSEFNSVKNSNKVYCNARRPPVKVIETSFLKKLQKEGESERPIYVLYPNYVLPNLDFLKEKEDNISKLLLMPQKPPNIPPKKRPFSCTDIENLRRKGLNHVKDWESLNFLLPQEYRRIFADLPEISEEARRGKQSSAQAKFARRRPLSCEIHSSSSSTGTQPSSGYRGSSTMLTDSQGSPLPTANLNPLFVYRYDSVTSSDASLVNSDRQRSMTMTTAPSQPQQQQAGRTTPLSRGILRRAIEKISDTQKRYGMCENNDEGLEDFEHKKFYQRNKRLSETEDEGVDAGTSSSSLDDHLDDFNAQRAYAEEMAQLDEFLKLSRLSISSDQEHDHLEDSLMHLRSYVSKFLSLKINQDINNKKCVSFAGTKQHLDVARQFIPPNNSPNVSAFLQQKNYQPKTLIDTTINEENENSPNYSSPQTTPIHTVKTSFSDILAQKRSLINAVADAVEQIMVHFSPATNQSDLNALGANPACAKLALNVLCPAVYAVLSDGLKPCLETSFGAITNSVWQVVEASSQQGPLTKALNDLVMRINSEDTISEGLTKFNSFVFGLLNVRSLDAWASYLRTRESILKKHYTGDSLMVMAYTGGANVRALLDTMIAALKSLAFLPFQLDMFFELKQLHQSFKRMDSLSVTSPTHKLSPLSNLKQFPSQKHGSPDSNTGLPDLLSSSPTRSRERPRSYVDSNTKMSFKLGDDDVVKKRWSGIAMNSKLYQAYDKLLKEEEYVDSLETDTKKIEEEKELESLDSNFSDEKPLNGKRFRKLQQKWEMLSVQKSESESPPQSPTHTKSKIPRPITSPIRPSGIPIPVSKVPVTAKPPPTGIPKANSKGALNKRPVISNRTSRVDQVETDGARHVQRPSSLPYKCTENVKGSKVTPPRRAASSSLSRRPLSRPSTPKVVKTLNHRLPSESGHLSYNKGEKLQVVLEVDEKWLLCCRGNQKGLVPRSAVIADVGRF
ncbi:unnamed protein product [Acanthoscelides obtectus]|uniref:Iporin n=1 Tax=Acanthoscelides obtectus TaxID=200917 RepID=A0A9P0M664_ACAOB|nr:unnamed protein product [Acanthoscelides obtectus]CAK1664093.1 Iporin [Acanthoscelides obtectus]